MMEGACLCGTVRWAADASPDPLSHCHCGMCRKAHGAPFATFTGCDTARFRWTHGQATIRSYRSSRNVLRHFCSTCGSALPDELPEGGDYTSIPAGGVTTPLPRDRQRHIYTAFRMPFQSIAKEIETHPGAPDDGDPPPGTAPGTESPASGTCLCGAVAFEISTPFAALYNCHCSRCRRARAAAHATNGFVPKDGLRFLRGEAEITVYRLPEAAVFGHAFCRTCGGGCPRFNPSAGIWNVPLGVLDRTAGAQPECHIHTDDIAPWYDIPDDMPRHPGAPPPR